MAQPRIRALVRALMHPIRATVEKHVHAADRPLSLADLEQLLDLEPRHVRYHVRVLEGFGLITLDDKGRATPA